MITIPLGVTVALDADLVMLDRPKCLIVKKKPPLKILSRQPQIVNGLP